MQPPTSERYELQPGESRDEGIGGGRGGQRQETEVHQAAAGGAAGREEEEMKSVQRGARVGEGGEGIESLKTPESAAEERGEKWRN